MIATSLELVESKITPKMASLLVATVLLAFAMLLVPGEMMPKFFGVHYAELADDPFQEQNPMAKRITVPLIAYLIGLPGNQIAFINLFFSWLLLACIYWHYRTKGWNPILCVLSSGTIAFTMPTLGMVKYPFFTDSFNLLVYFLMYVNVKRPWIYWGLFGLALFNREAALHFLPFFLLLQMKDLKNQLLPIALIGFAYFMFSLSVHTPYNWHFYLEPLFQDPFFWLRQMITVYFPLKIFFVFKLFWLLPLVALWMKPRSNRFWLILICLMGTFSQFLIAVDITRLMASGFLILLMGLEEIRDHVEENRVIKALLVITFISVCLPNYYCTGFSTLKL